MSAVTHQAPKAEIRVDTPYWGRPSPWLLWSTVAVATVALALPYLPGSALLGFVPLAPGVLALIIAVTLAYVLIVEAAKHRFSRAVAAR